MIEMIIVKLVLKVCVVKVKVVLVLVVVFLDFEVFVMLKMEVLVVFCEVIEKGIENVCDVYVKVKIVVEDVIDLMEDIFEMFC